MDLQKITSTGTAVAVIGGGTFMGGNYAVDQATGGPEKRIKAKQTELQLIVREEVRSALADMLPTSTGGVVRSTRSITTSRTKIRRYWCRNWYWYSSTCINSCCSICQI